MAFATMDQVDGAALHVRRFRTRGVAAAMAAPVLWMAFTFTKLTPAKRSGNT